MRSSRRRESLHRAGPIGPGAPEEGCPYRRVLCAKTAGAAGHDQGVRTVAKHEQGLEPPSETPALYPSFREELRLFYSGIGSGQSEESEPHRAPPVGAP